LSREKTEKEHKRITNLKELLDSLKEISNDKTQPHHIHVLALACAYILRDACPEDRTTEHVFRDENFE